MHTKWSPSHKILQNFLKFTSTQILANGLLTILSRVYLIVCAGTSNLIVLLFGLGIQVTVVAGLLDLVHRALARLFQRRQKEISFFVDFNLFFLLCTIYFTLSLNLGLALDILPWPSRLLTKPKYVLFVWQKI